MANQDARMDSTTDDSEEEEQEAPGWTIENRIENYMQTEKYTAAPELLKPVCSFITNESELYKAKNTP